MYEPVRALLEKTAESLDGERLLQLCVSELDSNAVGPKTTMAFLDVIISCYRTQGTPEQREELENTVLFLHDRLKSSLADVSEVTESCDKTVDGLRDVPEEVDAELESIHEHTVIGHEQSARVKAGVPLTSIVVQFLDHALPNDWCSDDPDSDVVEFCMIRLQSRCADLSDRFPGLSLIWRDLIRIFFSTCKLPHGDPILSALLGVFDINSALEEMLDPGSMTGKETRTCAGPSIQWGAGMCVPTSDGRPRQQPCFFLSPSTCLKDSL